MAREELATLERALAELPEDYRQVILLTRVMNLGHATVAEQMGRSETATRSLLHRALARLARLMAEQG
jgi:RNA polymerase sigma-70 factor (ECF subfamily)